MDTKPLNLEYAMPTLHHSMSFKWGKALQKKAPSKTEKGPTKAGPFPEGESCIENPVSAIRIWVNYRSNCKASCGD